MLRNISAIVPVTSPEAENATPRSCDQALVLFAPAALRHDRLPALSTDVRPVPWPGDAPQRQVNTILIPAHHLTSAGHGGDPGTDPITGMIMAPLFCLLTQSTGCWLPSTLLSCTGEDYLYIRLPGPLIYGDPASASQRAAWADDLSARHRLHGPQLGNHRCWYRNLLPGLEAEHKFTLDPAADIWHLAVRTHQLLRGGGLPGWICEHGNNGGFEQWDFVNHLYEITQPDTERGYIAFIPTVDGRNWIIRRKRYQQDQVIRREELTEAPDLGPAPELSHVIWERFRVRPAWGKVYRRVRYNVMLESLATGHIFSIMYDRCTTRQTETPPLIQAEVEYIHSRTLRECSPAEVLHELSQLTTWTRELLAHHGVPALENQLSKLTWLRRADRRRD